VADAVVAEPAAVDVERERGVTVTWADGHMSRFGLEELRLNCPCAECRGLRDRGQVPGPGPGTSEPLRIESAETVGAWGLNFVWNDRHSTGIFTWEVLRSWCSCPECAA
jgi:DUF971 family protein